MRRTGTVGVSGKPVGNRMIDGDLTFPLAILNWAARSWDEEGELLLESNPLRGLKARSEKNPTRVMPEYEALLRVAGEVN